MLLCCSPSLSKAPFFQADTTSHWKWGSSAQCAQPLYKTAFSREAVQLSWLLDRNWEEGTLVILILLIWKQLDIYTTELSQCPCKGPCLLYGWILNQSQAFAACDALNSGSQERASLGGTNFGQDWGRSFRLCKKCPGPPGHCTVANTGRWPHPGPFVFDCECKPII